MQGTPHLEQRGASFYSFALIYRTLLCKKKNIVDVATNWNKQKKRRVERRSIPRTFDWRECCCYCVHTGAAAGFRCSVAGLSRCPVFLALWYTSVIATPYPPEPSSMSPCWTVLLQLYSSINTTPALSSALLFTRSPLLWPICCCVHLYIQSHAWHLFVYGRSVTLAHLMYCT